MRPPTGTFTFHRAFDNSIGHVLCWKDKHGNEIRIQAEDFWAGVSAFSMWDAREGYGMIEWTGLHYHKC